MKKSVALIVCFFVFFSFGAPVCFAEALSEEQSQALEDFSSEISESLDKAVDSETKQTISEHGINASDPSELTLSGIISAIWNEFTEAAVSPIKTLGQLAAVIILSAVARSMATGSVSRTFMTVSVLGCITVIYQTVYSAFESVCVFLERLSDFMLAYIPIYASVTAASGSYTSGGCYYASSLGICELIAFLSQKVIMPFLSIFLALSFTSAINPDMKFSSAAQSIKNAVHITLTALMTIFTGLISVQSLSGSAADGAAAKALKFGASNFIPIIGGSVSEAYSTVYAGIGVIRTGVGTLGIIVAGAMLLKPIVTLRCVKLVLGVAGLISDIMGCGETSELLKSSGFAVSAAISTVLCFCMMFIISTAILMLTAANCVP
jgi:stage III sporulation protein AE